MKPHASILPVLAALREGYARTRRPTAEYRAAIDAGGGT
jgi:hypothetical protein